LDAGQELISSSTLYHIIAIFALIGVIAFNFYTVHSENRFIFLAKKLKKITPVFHSINFCVAYTGAVLAGFTHNLSWTVVLMIPTALFIMITEIKRYKKMRVITLENIQAQEEFKIFAKKIYTMQIITIVVMYIIAKLF
jgi:hypothetical protein